MRFVEPKKRRRPARSLLESQAASQSAKSRTTNSNARLMNGASAGGWRITGAWLDTELLRSREAEERQYYHDDDNHTDQPENIGHWRSPEDSSEHLNAGGARKHLNRSCGGSTYQRIVSSALWVS